MITVPTSQKELVSFTNDLVEQCRISAKTRASYCQTMNTIAETGRYDGVKSLVNLLYKHLDRTAAHLFSPVELKFAIDFENRYPKTVYDEGAMAAQVLRRRWERSKTDITFGRGVFDALKYGAVALKQWTQAETGFEDDDIHAGYYKKLVMPWQLGVYDESEVDINNQIAICETAPLTMPQVWRRIAHMPDARKLYDRIKANGMTGQSAYDQNGFFHQILSTSQLNTTGTSSTNRPGGILQLNGDPTYSIMGPQVGGEIVMMHELWVQDDHDYTTIIMIEPDIIIAPTFKKSNLLIQGSRLQPYRMIRPNEVSNWFWGRSELVDLIEPQSLLGTWCEDAKRLTGLQVDKLMGFTGETGMTDELYGQFRSSGYMNLPAGGDIKDITPKFPAELLPMIKFMIETINNLSGFPPIMQGQGEAGVRAGSHATTLMKTASPTLRDRALLVEQQCADAADLTLSLMEAKDPNKYWINGDDRTKAEDTSFLLSDLPDDWRVIVDSHSSSPIFSDENTQLVVAAHKMGVVDANYVIDNVPLPNKEAAKVAYRERQQAQQQKMQQLLQQFPDAGEKVAVKQLVGKR